MLKTKEEIKAWLDKYKIKNYTIKDDLTVDVNGNVDIQMRGLEEIPIHFGTVTGDFNCRSNKLTTCSGFPLELSGDLNCSNNELTSLIGCPKFVNAFICEGNNLTSLIGGPENVKETYECASNRLISLNGSPLTVGSSFNCSYNKLESLDNGPKYIGENFIARQNPIKSLIGFPCNFQKEFWHNGDLIPNLEYLYQDIGISILVLEIKRDELMCVIQKLELMEELSIMYNNDNSPNKKPKI